MAILDTEKQSWIIDIPDCHPSLNAWTRMHWGKRNKMKADWEKMVFYCAQEAQLPRFKEPVEMFITYYHPRKTVDLDNYTPKFIIDGLKTYFQDDSIQYLTKLGWTFKKGDKRSVVEIKLSTSAA